MQGAATSRQPCKRCVYNEAKLDGSRKRRRFCLEDMRGAPYNQDIIGYNCDVGIKSLLRSICEFYQTHMRTFLSSYQGRRIMHDEVIGAFISTQVLSGQQGPVPTEEELSISLVSLLSASTNLARKNKVGIV